VILEECHRFLIIVQFTISLAQFRHTLDDRQETPRGRDHTKRYGASNADGALTVKAMARRRLGSQKVAVEGLALSSRPLRPTT
jgi:hypothetical protein